MTLDSNVNIKFFLDFTNLYCIESSKRIKIKTKAEVIRFIFIVFDISRDKNIQLNHNFLRNILNDYFVGNDGLDIKFASQGTEFSRSRNENMDNREFEKMVNIIDSNRRN